MALVHLNFFSQYLMMNTDVNIILPNAPKPNPVKLDQKNAKAFYESGKKYRTLLLLHGRWEDYTTWTRCTNIETYACENDLIVVMPSGLNSNWQEWKNYGLGMFYYGYLMEELMPMVHSWFPASSLREDNFIAGHSMGGCGAMRLSLLYPDRFAKCATISSNERKYPDWYEKNIEKGNWTVTNWIDAKGGIEPFMDSVENVRGTLEKMSAEEIAKLPEYYIATGGDDDEAHLKQFSGWTSFCEAHGLKVTTNIAEGYGHDGYYFDHEIRNVLRFFGFAVKNL